MNREIRFRAWDKITKTMRTNILSIDVGEYGRNIYFSTGSYLPQIDAELMQYTGLKDKNGKKIYEGDIIKTDTQIGVVDYSFGCFRVRGKKIEIFGIDLGNGQGFCEVIGDIYQNPELLKK